MDGTRLVEKAKGIADYALDGQTRKISGEPAFNHAEAVARLVRSCGGDDVTVAAAFVHDVFEDAPEKYSREAMQRELGTRVVKLVENVSERKIDNEGHEIPWLDRKQQYIDMIREAPYESVLISAADKVHNLSTVLNDYDNTGSAIWLNFNGSPRQQLWYYTSMNRVFMDVLGPGHKLVRRMTLMNIRLSKILPRES